MLTAGFLFLAGCGGAAKVPDTVKQNSLIIRKDGSVTAHIVDVFDKDYYKLEDLSLMAQNEVARYNKDRQGENNAVTLLNIGKVEDSANSVIVSYEFQNAQTYTDYTDNILFYGTVEEAVKAGYAIGSMNQVLYAPSGENSIVASELTDSAKSMLSKHIVLVQEATCVYCPYQVSYISDTAKCNEDGSIDTNGVYADQYPVVIVLDR